MKLTDYIADFLAEKEITHIFNGHGGVVIHALNSIGNHPKLILIPVQNEQAAALAADGYSRVSGNIGVCVATSGPGVINLLQGVVGAYYDSIPMLVIVGADITDRLRKDNQKDIRQIGFQEMSVIDICKPFTKYAVTIKDPLKIRYELEKCFYMAKEGRPAPVVIEIPDNSQRADIEFSRLTPFKPIESKTTFTPMVKDILQLKKMIKESKRPLIIAGAGVKNSQTYRECREFADIPGIPVLPTWACVDLFPDSPRFGISSHRAGNFAIQNSDLLICLGTRLDSHLTGNLDKFAPNAKIVMVDIDKTELNRLSVDLRIHCNLKEFFKIWHV